MFDVKDVKSQFAEECTGCGVCIEPCPIVPHTELAGVDPQTVMAEVVAVFRENRIGDLARKRIYSCLYCNTCAASCPQGIHPALVFGAAKGVLRELGDPVPKGMSAVPPFAQKIMEQAILSMRKDPVLSDCLITDVKDRKAEPPKTLLFPSCFGMIQEEVIRTAVKILKRIDPGIKVLAGYEYCCGELDLIAGHPEKAEKQFVKMLSALNTLSPENVVIFCPTCNMNFDERNPDSSWSWRFITDFIVGHLPELGVLRDIKATVTVHDSCHFVRSGRPASNSPREILNAIPGIRIVEMENTGENALCCGAYAISGSGTPGLDFRDRRLTQAQETGADILGLYCPGCHMIFGPEGPGRSIRIESVLSLLGQSLGLS